MEKFRKLLGPVLGLVISVVFLILALYNVRLGDVLAALRTANYALVALAAVFTFGSYLLRTARWARFLRPQKSIPIPRLFPVLVIGFALNNLFPGRPGEFARAISLGQREGLSKTLVLATVLVERVADGLALITILALLSLVFQLPGWGQQVEFVSLVIFVAALAALLLLLWRESLATQLLNRALAILPGRLSERLGGMFTSFMLGLRSLRSASDLLAIAFLSLCVWACEATHYFIILSAFGLIGDPGTRVLAAIFTMVIVNLSIALPAAPGGVGVFEWAGSNLALGAFGIPPERALPAVLVAHTIQYLLVTGLGALLTAREGVRLARPVEEIKPG